MPVCLYREKKDFERGKKCATKPYVRLGFDSAMDTMSKLYMKKKYSKEIEHALYMSPGPQAVCFHF
jgi:hypothetical protein